MIIESLKLKNFRQFKDEQTLLFATDPDQNVTVVFGENGRGKTGLFRATMFALYGDKVLSQDEGVDAAEVNFVNTPAMEEAGGKAVECFVELYFKHRAVSFRVKRVLNGLLQDENRYEEMISVSLAITDKDGNTKNIKDPDEITAVITNILDKNIREYFLFDGEKIQRLTLASSSQRKEISKGIRNLLKVDTLEKSIKLLDNLKKDINKEISSKATGEYGLAINRKTEFDEQRNKIKAALFNNANEIELSEDELKDIDKRLEAIKEVMHLVKERQSFETLLTEKKNTIQSIISEIKTKSGKFSLILLKPTIDFVFAEIENKKEKGQIPSEIRKDLIEKILSDELCICHRSVIPGTPEFLHIIEWKNKTADAIIENSALDIWRLLSSIRSHSDDYVSAAASLLQNYVETTNEVEQIELKIKNLNVQIGDSVKEGDIVLEKARDEVRTKLTKLEAEKINFTNNLKSIEIEYAELVARIKILKKQMKIKDELNNRAVLVEETSKTLSNIYDAFTFEIRNKVEETATDFMHSLLDEEGKETLKKIIVDENYSIQILNQWNRPFLANISAGQRQIISLSFISALTKIAAGDKMYEMPLFMDTPFGRLSYSHRKNLIDVIPKSCSQWILLATDTEFSRQESTLLRASKKWGKFYRLQSDGPGTTRIKQVKTEEAHLFLTEKTEDSYAL